MTTTARTARIAEITARLERGLAPNPARSRELIAKYEAMTDAEYDAEMTQARRASAASMAASVFAR